MSIDSLADWFQTSLGQYVLAREHQHLDEVVADIFGFNAMQVGLARYDFLRASRIPLRFALGREGPVRLVAEPSELPVATQSMDLVILAHVLEFSREPHQILREVDRVMMPEGRLIITGFNPWSLWGLRQAFDIGRREYPWRGNFISLTRMKDWLALLGFDVSSGRLCCYVPPIRTEQWLQRVRFMEQAGDRWWGIAGGVYILQAIKRVLGMRLITPSWERTTAKKAMAPVAKKTAELARAESSAGNVIRLRRKRLPF
jgi:SAM-dependent methyltransferase